MTGGVWEQDLGAFLEAAASDAPTPGGGSVAMVSGALGLGLVLMALRVTARGRNAPDVSGPIERGEALLADFREAPAADMVAFDALMGAYRLPRANEAEQAARRAAIEAATSDATRIPLEAAGLCLRALELAQEAAGLSKPSILSDVAAGALLLRSAGDAVLLNVDINLPGLPEGPQREAFATQRRQIAERLAVLAASVETALKARG